MSDHDARAESERRFREMAAIIPGVFWDTDVVAHKVLYVSPAYERIWGRSCQSLLDDATGWMEAIHPEDRGAVEKHWFEVLAARGALLYSAEFRIIRPDGSIRWIHDQGAVVADAGGDPARIVGFASDITDRREAEAERRKAQRDRRVMEASVLRAQKLESLGVLAGGIAHDFSNLLVGVLGNVDLARMHLPPGTPAWERLEGIEIAATRAAELCEQMLAYSGRGRFVIEALDLDRVIEEMIGLLGASISKKAELRFEPASGLPAVQADGTQVRQVIMNLITNASDAIGAAEGVIQVRTGAAELDAAGLQKAAPGHALPPGLYAWVEVADDGAGMDEATLDKIFEPFFTTKFTGRGLGLAAVQGIVRGHGGAIHIDSAPGRGTTVRVLFPAAGRAAAGAAPPSAEGEGWQGGGTVLLVDDESSVRAVGRAMLEQLGATVLTAADGCEAVEVFRERGEEITAVILDLTMPHVDGGEVLRRLRALRPGLPVLLSSAYHEHDVRARVGDVPVAGFLRKPYTSEELLARLREALLGAGPG